MRAASAGRARAVSPPGTTPSANPSSSTPAIIPVMPNTVRSSILKPDHINNEMFTAWRKDAHERTNVEAAKRYREIIDQGVKDKEVSMRNAHCGINIANSLASLLARTPVVKIDLYQNNVQDTGCEAIALLMRETASLTHLNLGGNDIGPHGGFVLASVIPNCRKLQVLILGSEDGDPHVNRIDPPSGKALFEAAIACRSLKVLDLSRNPIGRKSQEAFPAAANLLLSSQSLQVLKLGSTEMSHESAMQLAVSLSRSPSIATLDIHDNHLTAQVGEVIGKSLEERARRGVGSSLKALDLHGNTRFGERGSAPIFRALAKDKGLASISLRNTGVDDTSIATLCDALLSNATVTHLDLSANRITDVGALDLARALARHMSIQTLLLGENKIRDDGACGLAALLEHNRSLQDLDLDNAWIGDRGAIALGVALANNTTLRHLKLSNNHVGDEGGSALAALLDKNRTLLNCSLKGNSIFHSTALQVQKVINRNKLAKSQEKPNELKRKVTKLQFQEFKLGEAKTDLDFHRSKKNDLVHTQDRLDRNFQEERIEFVKRQNDLRGLINDQETQADNIKKNMLRDRQQHEVDMKNYDEEIERLEEKLKTESAERVKAEEELDRIQQEVAEHKEKRERRLVELKDKIELARDDKERWSTQLAELRQQADQVQTKLTELEELQHEKQMAAASAALLKEQQKQSKLGSAQASPGAQTGQGGSIAALLNAQ